MTIDDIFNKADEYMELCDEVQKDFPKANAVMVLYAASCRIDDKRFVEPNMCNAKEDCLYRTLFDGIHYCEVKRE